MARFEKLEFEHSSSVGEQVAGSRGGDARSWMSRAEEMRRIGAYEGALRYYSRALEDDKSLVSCWGGQVQMLVQLGEHPEADLWSRKALELFPNNGELLAARAQALCRLHKRRDGLAAIDGALAQEGQSSYRWMVRGELLLAQRQATHRHCFDRALQCDADWLAPVEISLIHQHYRQFSNALIRAKQGVERDPAAPYAWYVRASCEHRLGMDGTARRSLAQALELKSDYGDALNLLAATETGGSIWTSIRRLWRN